MTCSLFTGYLNKIVFWAFLISSILTYEVSALEPGNKAPSLKIARWIKNGPVKLVPENEDAPKKIYVIEFWTTWSPPSRQILPHLNFLMKKYKGKNLDIVAVSNEKPTAVEKFISGFPELTYHIAVDNNNMTVEKYMENNLTFPFSFIIGEDGEVLWKGEHFDLDNVLSKVFDGTFDLDEQKQIATLKKRMQTALQRGKRNLMIKNSEEILEIDPEDRVALQVRLFVFERENKYREAIAFLDKLIEKIPNYVPLYLAKLEVLSKQRKTLTEMHAWAQNIARKFANDPNTLQVLAWTLLSRFRFGTAPLATALSAAKKAVRLMPADADNLTKARFYDTVARAYYAVGKFAEAVEIQKQVVGILNGPDEKKEAAMLLKYYQDALKLSQ